MADYVYLPPIQVTAAADNTGNNTGNWTAQIPVSGATMSYLTNFECYKVTIDGPVGFALKWDIDNYHWSRTAQGWLNEWDPTQPAPVRAGQTMFFYFAAPIANTPVPVVTAWFRYDPALNPGAA